jgi:hypothetical protein
VNEKKEAVVPFERINMEEKKWTEVKIANNTWTGRNTVGLF